MSQLVFVVWVVNGRSLLFQNIVGESELASFINSSEYERIAFSVGGYMCEKSRQKQVILAIISRISIVQICQIMMYINTTRYSSVVFEKFVAQLLHPA